MRQTTLCVPLEVKPESCSRLSALVEQLTRREDMPPRGYPENFARIAREIPTLHFMSMSVFPATDYDPIFVIEANFDGEPGVFWGQLEAAVGDDLREIVRCCKKPRDDIGALYEAVTEDGSGASLAAYLEARTQSPSVFHHGNRGLTRDRILAEAALFGDVRRELDGPARTGPSPYRGIGAAAAHAMLRARMRAGHPWLDASAPKRITGGERAADLRRLVSFAVQVLLVLSLPGILIVPYLPKSQYVVLVAAPLIVVLAGALIYRKREPPHRSSVRASVKLLSILVRGVPLIVFLVAAYVVLASVLPTLLFVAVSYVFEVLRIGHTLKLSHTFWAVADVVLWGLLSLVVTLPLLLLWLRYLERRDSAQDAPYLNERLLREMVRREDWIAQNHMGSIVLIKPGLLRTALIRAGHLGLGLALRVTATDGYLGSMRTVHFAHWAFLNNGSRLLFLSNFDHSWDSYLDDFIEKAHAGLTLAWGQRRGFSAGTVPHLRRRQPRAPVQGLGTCLARRQSILVQCLSQADRGPDRAQQPYRRRAASSEHDRAGGRDVDEGPVASQPARQWPSWKLEPSIAALTQGLIVTGFGGLQTGRALFLEIAAPSPGGQRGGAWLGALNAVAPVTSATPDPAGQPRAAAVAFTWSGLARMNLPGTALASFSRPFREGMMQEDRLRRLGDRRSGRWCETVVPGGPVWSGNAPLPAKTEERVGAYDVAHGDTPEHVPTGLTVHAILLLYTDQESAADDWAATVEGALAPHGVTVVHHLGLVLDVEQRTGFSREHFGFADGLSQPAPFDEGGAVLLSDEPVRLDGRDKVQGVPLGEILMGYVNGHNEVPPGPVVPGDDPAAPDHRAEDARLPPVEDAQGFHDLGINGSYLVVRELKQDVAAFWKSMDDNAAAIRASDPANAGHVTADWLAERVIGRSRDGHLLCPGGHLPPDTLGLADSGFLFYPRDPRGVGCPPGSHVRRANPRDGLAPTEGGADTLLAAANNHRILRRGRKFGTRFDAARADEYPDRGLLFMCLNTDIARQFEFVQQTWLLNSNFATLYEETDPLVGPKGRMTIREEPLRRMLDVATFIRMAGGDYFFLPSLPALRYLASL